MKWHLIGYIVLTVFLNHVKDNEAKLATEQSSSQSSTSSSSSSSSQFNSNALQQNNENIETINREMDLTAENVGNYTQKNQQEQIIKNNNNQHINNGTSALPEQQSQQQQQEQWILKKLPIRTNTIGTDMMNRTKTSTTIQKKKPNHQTTKTIEIIYMKPTTRVAAAKKQIANNNNNQSYNNNNNYQNAIPHTKRQPLSFVNPFGQLVSFFGSGASDHLETLQEYNFLFNAEHHTIFQLHTIAGSSGRVLNVVSDTIGAAFGVNKANTPMIPTYVEEVQLYNAASLRKSKFNPFNPTRIIIHGWMGGSHAGIYNILIPEYLQLSAGNYNIITVDWGRGALADYITASYRVKPVGKVLAKFIDFLHREAGTRFEDIQLIGFSMGAHIAGIAGKFVQTGRIPVIYALDPAMPLFRFEKVEERVAISDADYLEVLHTSAGSYGYDRPLGHVDFYANFGSQQPGCFFNECSHFRSFQIFGESLRKDYNFELRGEGCDIAFWQDLTRNRRCLRMTGRTLTLGGGGELRNATEFRQRRGLYYLTTNAGPPYGKPKLRMPTVMRGKRSGGGGKLFLNKNKNKK